MTSTLANPAPASPGTGPASPLATTRCRCGGQLAALTIPAPTADHPRATRTVHLHTDADTTCTTAAPVTCQHDHCGDDVHPDDVAECVDGLDACCTCCQPY